MKNFLIGLGVVIVVLVLSLIGYYNSVIGMEENLKSLDAQVKNMYERRTDLIPQVTAVVKNYTAYEKGTLEGVTKLRQDAKNLDALTQLIKEGKVSSSEVSNLLASTLSSLKVTLEAYPQLKADTQFTSLFTELEGSENRIRVAIKDYNDTLVSYNLKIRGFPGNILASIFGFEQKERINPLEGKDIKSVPNVDKLLDTGTGN